MRTKKLLGALLLMGIVASGAAHAQLPPTLSLQGTLTSAQAGTSATPSMTFRLYSTPTGGSSIWSETQTVTLVSNGTTKLYSVILGNTNSLSGIPFDQQYYVGVTVGSGSELPTRIQLPISPYAVRARYADSVLSGIADGSITTAKLANGAVTDAEIAAGTVGLDKISTSSATNGQVLTYNGSNLVYADASAGLTLPYSQSASTASPELSLTQTGASNVGSFVINSPGSVASVLNLNHNGIGNGLAIQLSNASNGGRGLDVTQSGVGPGVFATSAGGNAVWGITSSISAAGVIGDNTFGEAVVGRNRGGNGVGAVVGRNDSSGYGVRGFNTKNGYGVLGQAGISGGTGTAGRFENVNAANTSDALQVVTNSSGNAARFTGNVVVNGNLTVSGTVAKGGGTFMIDHPLDPKNKILYHSFVESPEMKNIYDGVVKLDGNGQAVVELPDWFDALNSDFRYQLTPIGGSAPELYVAEEVSDNHFKIAGGKPGMKVSWLLTGVRHDAWAEKHRVQVEVEKTGEMRGQYIHPEVFNQSATMAIPQVVAEPNGTVPSATPSQQRPTNTVAPNPNTAPQLQVAPSQAAPSQAVPSLSENGSSR